MRCTLFPSPCASPAGLRSPTRKGRRRGGSDPERHRPGLVMEEVSSWLICTGKIVTSAPAQSQSLLRQEDNYCITAATVCLSVCLLLPSLEAKGYTWAAAARFQYLHSRHDSIVGIYSSFPLSKMGSSFAVNPKKRCVKQRE